MTVAITAITKEELSDILDNLIELNELDDRDEEKIKLSPADDYLLELLVKYQHLDLLVKYYDYVYDNRGDVHFCIIKKAIETNNVEIIKQVLRYRYESHRYDMSYNVLYEITHLPIDSRQIIELIKLYIKADCDLFEIKKIKIDKKIFLFLYNRGCHHQLPYKGWSGRYFYNSEIIDNIISYIKNSNYDEYVIEFLMLKEDDIINTLIENDDYFEDYLTISYIESDNYDDSKYLRHRDLMEKLEKIKNKYIKMFEDEGLCKDIGLVVLSYIFTE